LSTSALFTRSRLCFDSQEHAQSVGCASFGLCVSVCVCVCVCRQHPQFTARTARCPERPAQLRCMFSTHATPRVRPPGMCVCVCALFWLVMMSFWEFCTQLAPQQISSFLGVSAQIQECVCSIQFLKPCIVRNVKQNMSRAMGPRHGCGRTHVKPRFFNRHMAHACHPGGCARGCKQVQRW